MRKIVITLLLLVAASAVKLHAQIEQGKILAGGSVGFSFENSKNVYDGRTGDEDKGSSIWFTPRAGFFVTDAIAVGAGLNLSSASSKDEDDNKFTHSSISLSPFVRYYFPEGLFGQLEISLGSSKSRYIPDTGDDQESKSKLFGWSLGAGYAYFLNDNVAIEPMVSYNALTETDSDDTKAKYKSGTLMLNVGFSIYLD